MNNMDSRGTAAGFSGTGLIFTGEIICSLLGGLHENRQVKKAAFTLIELLAVIAILSVLAALALPSLNRVRTGAQTAKCSEHVRRLLVAFQMYAAENDGNLPYNYYKDPAEIGAPPLWWHRAIAPYIGFTWDDAYTADLVGRKKLLPEILRCPADPWMGKTYAVDPSYGCNLQLTKDVPHGGYPAGTPRTRLASVEHPAEMILLAGSGHIEEGGDVAWRIGKTQASQAPLARHNGYSPVGWLDGHVTMETADQLKKWHSEPSPWPHWEPPR